MQHQLTGTAALTRNDKSCGENSPGEACRRMYCTNGHMNLVPLRRNRNGISGLHL
jgi:hypothetical protein